MQLLLNFLDYDTGGVDGICGSKTRQAIRDFQKEYLTGQEPEGEEADSVLRRAVYERWSRPEPGGTGAGSFWAEICYFDRQEFACRCGESHTPYCSGFPVEPDETLVRLADRIRGHFGRPAHPTSGIRCKQHNADEGGVRNSRHLQGKALDFCIEGVSGAKLLACVQAQPETRYAYLVGGNVIHMDVN